MNIKQIQQLLEESESLKTVAQAYSELSANKLSNIRINMQNNIDFAKEVGDVSHIVKIEAARRGLPLPKRQPGIVHICITSNNRFYGNLERPLVRYFAESTSKVASSANLPTLRIMIGKTGLVFLKSLRYSLPFESFLLEKDMPNASEFKSIIEKVRQYATILVYHSRFKTVITQLPVISDISQSIITPDTNPSNIQYVFEPEIGEILRFFDGQILQILLDQTFLESDLARTASRLISMDQAETNANDFIKRQKKLLATAKREQQNRKILELIATLGAQRRVL